MAIYPRFASSEWTEFTYWKKSANRKQRAQISWARFMGSQVG
jgi:hypothetical protein